MKIYYQTIIRKNRKECIAFDTKWNFCCNKFADCYDNDNFQVIDVKNEGQPSIYITFIEIGYEDNDYKTYAIKGCPFCLEPFTYEEIKRRQIIETYIDVPTITKQRKMKEVIIFDRTDEITEKGSNKIG